MIDASHAEQKRASMVSALKKVGIGSLYADLTLEALGDDGRALKAELLARSVRYDKGYGLDMRGAGRNIHKLFYMLGRSLLVMDLRVRMIPLLTLVKDIRESEKREELEDVKCLLIDGFERIGPTPLTVTDTLDLTDFFNVRADNLLTTNVLRYCTAPAGWWPPEVEQTLKERNTVRVSK